MEIKQLLLSDLVPNNYNPNILTETKLAQLKKTIKAHGYLQFIIVRPDPNNEGKFIIVDGEHRWQAMKDEPEFQTPQNVIVAAQDEDTAKIQTINMNLLRGDLDRVKVSGILHDLLQTHTMDDIEALLGMTVDEIQTYEEMADFDMDKFEDVKEEIPEDPDLKEEEPVSTITIELDAEEEQMYHKAIGLLDDSFQKTSGDDKKIFLEIVRCFINLADPDNAELPDDIVSEETV